MPRLLQSQPIEADVFDPGGVGQPIQPSRAIPGAEQILANVPAPRPPIPAGIEKRTIGKTASPLATAASEFLTEFGGRLGGQTGTAAQQRQHRLGQVERAKSQVERAGLQQQAQRQQDFQNKLSLARILPTTEEGGRVELPSGRSLTIAGLKQKRETDPNRFVITNNGRGGVTITDRSKIEKDPQNAIISITPEDKGRFKEFQTAITQGLTTPLTPNENGVLRVAFENGGPDAGLREFNKIRDRQERRGRKTGVEQLATFRAEDTLRSGYLKELGDLPKIIGSFTRVNTFAKMNNKTARTAQSDLAMVFAFMKMLDPGSVVRESEFATAAQAGGIPETLLLTWNNLQELAREDPNARGLTENQVDRMFAEAKALFDVESKRKLAFDERFTGIARRRKLDPRNIINENLFDIGDGDEGGIRTFSVNPDGSVTQQ